MKIRIFIFLTVIAFTSKAQHSYYSSLNQNLLSLNPAFAGTNKQLRTQLISGATGFPKYSGKNVQSYYAGVDFLGKKYSGFGLSFNTSYAGQVLRTTQADFSYALHFTIRNKIKVVHAYQISYFEYRYDRTKLNFGEGDLNVDNGFVSFYYNPPPVSYKRNVDFSSGLLAYGKRFYAGISILSITQPDEGIMGVSKRPMTQIYQGKYRFLDPEKFNVDVYGFLKLQEMVQIHKDQIYTKTIRENFIQYGTYLNYRMISIHLAHRLSSITDYSAIVSGIAINKKGLKIGYNNRYNYATKLSAYFFNEFYLQYAFGRIKKGEEETQAKSIKLID